jgi:hypothetical protein
MTAYLDTGCTGDSITVIGNGSCYWFPDENMNPQTISSVELDDGGTISFYQDQYCGILLNSTPADSGACSVNALFLSWQASDQAGRVGAELRL